MSIEVTLRIIEFDSLEPDWRDDKRLDALAAVADALWPATDVIFAVAEVREGDTQ